MTGTRAVCPERKQWFIKESPKPPPPTSSLNVLCRRKRGKGQVIGITDCQGEIGSHCDLCPFSRLYSDLFWQYKFHLFLFVVVLFICFCLYRQQINSMFSSQFLSLSRTRSPRAGRNGVHDGGGHLKM